MGDLAMADEKMSDMTTKLGEMLGDLNEASPVTEWTVLAPQGQQGLQTNLRDEPEILFLKNHVDIWVVEGQGDAFIEATLANVSGSIQEDGIARFDFLQDLEDPLHFALVEVFKNADSPAEHKKTEHYLTWRASVADMMAKSRSAIK